MYSTFKVSSEPKYLLSFYNSFLAEAILSLAWLRLASDQSLLSLSLPDF